MNGLRVLTNEAHHQYGWLLGFMGRNAEAKKEMERAQQLDPLSLVIAADSNVPYYLAREYDRSIEQSRKILSHSIQPSISRKNGVNMRSLSSCIHRLGYSGLP